MRPSLPTLQSLGLFTLGVLAAALLCGDLATAGTSRGSMRVNVSGFAHGRGHVIAKLFRRGDDAPKGPGHRRLVQRIKKRRAALTFSNVPYGTYALFLFHDENDNGTIDHNLLRMPTEPLGFSGGFKVSLFSGVPDFDDLKFEFTSKSPPLAIVVE